MRKVYSAILVLACAWTVGAPPAWAQAPNTMTYQGRLTDAAGAPITTASNVIFAIFAAATGGSPLWAETLSVTPTAQGIFTVELGGVRPITATILSGAKRYLELAIGSDVMSPRQLLTSGPYTIRSAHLPGVAGGGVSTASISLTSTFATVATQTATFPSDGHALILGGASINGATPNTWLNARILRNGTDLGRFWWWDGGDTDGWFDERNSLYYVVAVTAGSHTFELQVSTSSGTASSAMNQLVIVFFPTTVGPAGVIGLHGDDEPSLTDALVRRQFEAAPAVERPAGDRLAELIARLEAQLGEARAILNALSPETNAGER